MAKKIKTVLCYSGGLDSTVLLYYLLKRGDEVRCLSVNYGQRHSRELVAAKCIADQLGVEHRAADLSNISILLAGSSQTSKDVAVPDGHYAEESMKKTVVPNRNMILLSLATAWAVSTKSNFVAYAAHTGDHTIYPDCRPEFVKAMIESIRQCDWHAVELISPFLGIDIDNMNPNFFKPMSKTEIVKLGSEIGVPFENTWSCYKGGKVHCGTCGTCTERKEAFKLAGVFDPTCYLVG